MIDMRHELAAQCACRDDLFAQKANKNQEKRREEKTILLQHDAKPQPTASILEKETRGRKLRKPPARTPSRRTAQFGSGD